MMRRSHLALGVALAVASAAGSIGAGETPSALEIGHPAPALSLKAADGSTRTLSEGHRPVVLVFYRGLW
jgi:hypothetical protein